MEQKRNYKSLSYYHEILPMLQMIIKILCMLRYTVINLKRLFYIFCMIHLLMSLSSSVNTISLTNISLKPVSQMWARKLGYDRIQHMIHKPEKQQEKHMKIARKSIMHNVTCYVPKLEYRMEYQKEVWNMEILRSRVKRIFVMTCDIWGELHRAGGGYTEHLATSSNLWQNQRKVRLDKILHSQIQSSLRINA